MFAECFPFKSYYDEVPRQQQKARKSDRKVDFLTNLDISSRASNVRLTSLICNVGHSAFKNVDTLFDMMEAGMNIVVVNCDQRDQEETKCCLNTVSMIRKACQMYEEENGFDPCVAIVLEASQSIPRQEIKSSDDQFEYDLEAIDFAIRHNIDAIFLSNVQNGSTVEKARQTILNRSNPGEGKVILISKIEDETGCSNLQEIIRVSDGIIVGRGDLGLEMPTEKVFIAQKKITGMCNRVGKPVICAIQIVATDTHTGVHPTRAEAVLVANSIMDGIDGTMLSIETCQDEFPISCINDVNLIAREAEACMWSERFFQDIIRAEIMSGATDIPDPTHTIAISAVQAAYLIKAAAIVIITTSGKTAHFISKYKPQCPTVAVTRFAQVARQLQFYRGIIPIHYKEDRIPDWIVDVDERIHYGVDYGKKNGFIKSLDPIVCITGWRKGAGSSNTVRIINVN